ESYYAVYLTFDLIHQSIRIEDPFLYDEKVRSRFYYFGNNSAAASQTYLVRGADALHYLLTSVWNDLYLALQQQGLSSSWLAGQLQRLQTASLVSLGSKKGHGHLHLDKLQFPASFTLESISYIAEEKCLLINGTKKYKHEALLQLLLESENKYNRFVLVIPRIRDEAGEYVLSQHEDYLQLVKKLNRLDKTRDSLSAGLKHKEGDLRICYLCHEAKPDVSSSYSTKLSRSGINKIFTTTTINSARFTSAGYDYDDTYAVCGSCYQDLRMGENVIESNFRGSIAGESAFILPEHLLGTFDYQAIGAIKEGLDFAFGKEDVDRWLNMIDADTEWIGSGFYMLHFIIYRTDGNSVSILEAIEDVPTLRLVRIMKLFRHYGRLIDARWRSISLGSIYRMIPVRETDKGHVDVGRVLSLYKAILSGEQVRTELIYGYACEALDKGMRQLTKAHMDNYRNMMLTQYASGKEDFFILNITTSYLVLLHTLQQLRLLDRNFNTREEIEMSEDLMQFVEAESAMNPQVDSSSIAQVEQYLDKHAFTPEASALFYLGMMVQRVAWEQVKNKHKTKPVLKKIQFQGMKQHEIIRLAQDVYEKFRQYEIFSAYTEALIYRFNDNFGTIRDKWPLSEQANVFYLMAGYGYAAGNVKKKEGTDNRSQIEESEVVSTEQNN
ncbi:TM1802 family CRISPR-associated protein, partial [Paenibacillus sp.]|uniref:TM1802 family CRISPR-associated protein n=1 Tax=Paenibacillus sp. TaxID=58172 RepID=UPI003464E73E